tara:strand:+ start:29 stop:595 length:567 start_codon:yes stop_codon:yes gene_type:complete
MAINFATSKRVNTGDFTRSTHHTVLLFDKTPNSGIFNSVEFSITKNNFKNLFYKYDGKFGFCTNEEVDTILGSKNTLYSWFKSTGPGVALTTIQYDVVEDITGLWAGDTSISKTDWSSSVHIDIISQLLKVNNWTKLNYSNVLTLQEILTTFNQSDLIVGNKLTLSIMVDNSNTSAKSVEIILNFKIV